MIEILERLGDEVLWRYNGNDGVSKIGIAWDQTCAQSLDAELCDSGLGLHTDTRAEIKRQVIAWPHNSGEGQRWIEEQRENSI